MNNYINKPPVKDKNLLNPNNLNGDINEVSTPISGVSNSSISLVIDMSPMAISVTRLKDGKILNVNRGFEILFKCKKKNILGQSSIGFWPTLNDRKKLQKILHDSGKCKDYEYVIHPDDNLVTLLVSAHIIKIDGEQCIFAIGHDISERIKAEKQMRIREEEKFSAAIDASPDAIVVTRASDGMIRDANEGALKLSGYTREEVIGKTTVELGFYTADERNIFTELLKKDGKYVDREFFLKRKDGNIVNTLSSAVVINIQGEFCIFAIIHDITHRKQAENALKESQQMLSSAFQSSPDAITISRLSDGMYLFVNPGHSQISGYSPKEVIGKTPMNLGGWINEKDWKILGSKLKGKRHCSDQEYKFRTKSGETIHARLSGSVIQVDEEACLFAITRDITSIKEAESALAASETKFRMLYHDTPAMFFNISKDGIVLSVNQYGAEQLGYKTEELLGKTIETVIHREDRETVRAYFSTCFKEPNKVHRWEVRQRCRNGREIWVRETIRVVNDKDGLASLFIVCEDITETYRLSQKLSYQASHDSLTGLVNRAEFERRVEKVMETNRINPSHHALCYLDLDQFKVINDSGGHLAGDELLRQLSNVLLSRVRQADTFARLGGDEFGVLMEDCALDNAVQLANVLREEVEDFRFVWQEKKFSVGVSIGLVPIVDSSGNVQEILSAADAACYAAKDAGRNRIHVYSSDDQTMAKRRGEMQWVNRINQALEEDRLRLYQQKIVSTNAPNQNGHYELLLRMSDEKGKLIPPGAFLPAAERFGLSTKIDQWVVNKALSWLAQHPAKLEALRICAINLSGQSLGNDEFMESLLKNLEDSGIPGHKICFEITETSAIANLTGAIRFINKFRNAGCLFALDDFGSGVSSFGYLKNLPVDFIKIDGSFVRDITTDEIDRAMVKAITEIGQIMGKKTIAEFVENDATMQELKKLGVDYAQGYGIAKPRALYNIKNNGRNSQFSNPYLNAPRLR